MTHTMCTSEVAPRATENGEPITGGMETTSEAVVAPKKRWCRAGLDLVSGSTSRDGAISLASQGVVSITTFLTSVLVGRACSKTELGLYMLGFSIVVFVTSLQTWLISIPYMIHSPLLRGSARAAYAGSTFIHQLGFSAIVILALVVGTIVAALGIGPEHLASVLGVLTVVIGFIALKDYARRIYFADLRMWSAFALDCSVAGIQVIGLLLLAHLGLVSPHTVYWIIGLACAVPVAGWYIRNRSAFVLLRDQTAPDFARNWSSGKWIAAGGLLWMGVTTLYPWILVGFLGTAAVGVWGVCIGVVGLGNPILIGLNNFFGPKLAHSYAHGGTKALRTFVINASLAQSLIVTPLCVLLVACGGLLVVVFYGDKYMGNGLVVAILGVNLLVTAAGFCVSRALFAMERAKVEFTVNAVAQCLLLTVGLWLIRSFGLPGAAWALLLTNAAVIATKSVVFIRLTRTA